MGHRGHRRDVQNLDSGVAERLREDEPGVFADGRREVVGTAGIDEGGGDPEAPQREVKHVVGAAVDVAAGHDMGPRAHERGNGQKECGLALAVATAPTPPSRAATRSSSTATVGLEIRE